MDYKNLTHRSLSDEADAWIVKLRSEGLSRADKVQFSRWLNVSHAHRKAFDESMAFWETLGAASYVIENDSVKHSTSTNAHATEQHATPLWRKLAQPLPATFSAIAALLIIGFITLNPPSGKGVDIQHYQSATGKTRSITLTDGSTVDLNTGTHIEVAFYDKQRSIRLLKGEAFFNVATDTSRPLVVDFGAGTATAVGTAFNVYRSPTNASVTVTEGLVDVRESADIAVPHPRPTRLKQDQQIRINKRGMQHIRNVSPENLLAWRDQTIIFNDTPLTEALGQLNRYMDKPAYAEDIGELKISGTFSLTSPEETLAAIVTAFNLEAQDAAPYNALYLRPE